MPLNHDEIPAHPEQVLLWLEAMEEDYGPLRLEETVAQEWGWLMSFRLERPAPSQDPGDSCLQMLMDRQFGIIMPVGTKGISGARRRLLSWVGERERM